jgi:acyl-CoA synthetase (AMP-forming)/AMP-acid ligase II
MTVTAEELTAHCRTRIAGYKLPRSVDFVATLPKTGSGKIQKTALREPFWRGHQRQVN